MASLALVFDILAKDEASKTFKQVGDEAERTGKRAESGLGGIANAAKIAGGALLGAGIISGFRELYDAAASGERVTRLTEAAIRSTGGAAKVSAGQVTDLAVAISRKTGIDDEAIQSGQNLLLTFTNIRNEVGNGNDIFNQATQALADMSTALGTDASSSAVQLGKALNDPISGITSLSRAGVQFTEDQKTQIRTLVESGNVLEAQKIILGELETQFGGAAEAAATPLGILQARMGEIAGTLGEKLIPLVDDFADVSITAIEGVSAGFETGAVTADGFEGAMQGVGVALGDVVDFGGEVVDIGQGIVGFFADLPGPVVGSVAALGTLVALRGPIGSTATALSDLRVQASYAPNLIAGMGGAAGVARTGLGNLTSFLGGPWGIALGAGVAALGAFVPALLSSDDAAEDAASAQGTLATAIRATSGAIDDSVRRAAAKELQDQDLIETLGFYGIASQDLVGYVLGEADAHDRVSAALDAQRDSYAENGVVSDGLRQGVENQRAALDELAQTTSGTIADERELAEATGAAGTAFGSANPQVEDFAATTERLQGEVSEAKNLVDAFRLALDQLDGGVINTTELEGALFTAVNNARTALEGTTGAVLDNTGALNTQTTAGVAAADSLFGVIDVGYDLISNQAQLGESTEQLTGRAQSLRDQFIAAAEQMGINQDEASVLADRYGLIPANVVTEVTADTSSALAAVNDFVTRVSGTRVTLTGDFVGGAGVVVRNAMGNLLEGGSAAIVPPNTWRVIGDRIVDDEAYIPINGDRRSRDILGETAKRMGYQLAPADVALFADGGILDSLSIPVGLTGLQGIQVEASGAAGSGSVGSGWQSIWNFVKARIPQARINSTYRPGDPGYHGRGKAIDFGFGSGPGGAGSAGLASINRLLHDSLGGNLAELIYDGIGDDRPDLKNGRPLTYSSSTRAQHRNHVHAATYDDGGLLRPGYTLAFNGTGQSERVRTAEQEAALHGAPNVNVQVFIDGQEFRGMARVVADNAVSDALAYAGTAAS